MQAAEHGKAYGVFKPVGCVVVAFPPDTNLLAVELALVDAEIPRDDVSRLSPAQMIAQADEDIAHASGFASIGQELNLVKAQRELALHGQSFLVIRVSDDDAVGRVTDIAERFHASRAQRYGRLIVEELVAVGSTDRQVPESPDSGLDHQTRTGNLSHT
jgi:hypothetical protein